VACARTLVLVRTGGLFLSAYATLVLDVWYWRTYAASAIAVADASMGLAPAAPHVPVGRSASSLRLTGGAGSSVGVDLRPLLTAGGPEGVAVASPAAAAAAAARGAKDSAPAGGEPAGGLAVRGRDAERPHAIAPERAHLIPELLAPATRQLLETAQTVWMLCPCLVQRVRGMRSHVAEITYNAGHRGIGGSTWTDSSDDSDVWLQDRDRDREIHESQLISSAREINDGTYGRVYAGLWGKKLVAIKIFKQSVTDRRGEATAVGLAGG
jgi:hypothetical protein